MNKPSGVFKAKRKEVKDVRCYKIGCREKYPHWLRKAIAQGYIKIEDNVGGLVDVATFYRGNRAKHFYEGDYIVKLPEGPIIAVPGDKFEDLYVEQHPDAWVADILAETDRCPYWALQAKKNGVFSYYTLQDGTKYLQYKNGITYYTKTINEMISYEEVFGKINE